MALREVLATDLHQLATLIGALGLRWYALRSGLPGELAGRDDVLQFESSLDELRARVRKILTSVPDGHADEAQSQSFDGTGHE
ncbi:MAG: hypothetical protein SFV23_14395 [Planctomycetaceae bacterium]|nr:hypothetical protein [Planctomycetaceae bacterium]